MDRPKTCSNCLHWTRDAADTFGVCERVEMAESKARIRYYDRTMEVALATHPGFGCNQHEEAEVPWT